MNYTTYWRMHVTAKNAADEFLKRNVAICDAELIVAAETAFDAIKTVDDYFSLLCPVHVISVEQETLKNEKKEGVKKHDNKRKTRKQD